MINEIEEKIKQAKKILLISHVNPDGDTLGSVCAMKLFIGEKADILIQTESKTGVPDIYKFLPGINNAKFLDTVEDIYDLFIALDVASIDRIVELPRVLFNKAENTINIDHHKTNKGYASINLIKGGYSSTGEVLFDFFNDLKVKITKEIAICLYVAILTDTGCFRYETVSDKTFLAAAKLSETGINTAEIAKKCYDNKPKSMVTFQADIIANAKFALGGKVAYAIITSEKMKKFKVKNEHTEGIAETLRSISSVDISIVLKENEDKNTKISLRSKTIDLTPVAEAFGGGGHTMAAGCTIKKPAKIAIELLLDKIAKCINC